MWRRLLRNQLSFVAAFCASCSSQQFSKEPETARFYTDSSHRAEICSLIELRQQDPLNVDIHYQLLSIYLEEHFLPEALTELGNVIRLLPNRQENYTILAELYLRSEGSYAPGGVSDLAIALERFPSDPIIRAVRAMMLVQTSKQTEASEQAQIVLNTQDDHRARAIASQVLEAVRLQKMKTEQDLEDNEDSNSTEANRLFRSHPTFPQRISQLVDLRAKATDPLPSEDCMSTPALAGNGVLK